MTNQVAPEVAPHSEQGMSAHEAPERLQAPGLARRDDIFFIAVETTRMPMLVTDPNLPDNPIVFANKAFLGMTGYTVEELLGRNCRFLQGKDTSRKAVSDVRAAVLAVEPIDVEILNYRKDGTAFWNALFICPVKDPAGKLIYFFASQLDVSRRHEAEAALEHSVMMALLGQLTAGIAHDFNNMMTVIRGNLEYVLGKVRIEQALKERLNRVATVADSAGKKVQQLLAFARKQDLTERTLSLNALVEEWRDLGQSTLGVQCVLTVNLAPDVWPVHIDAVQASTTILNILLNARDAMPDGGSIVMSTGNRVVADGDRQYDDLPPGRYASISITDTGIGMSPEVQRRCFEPFFTTKEVGSGTGLGLAQVHGFVHQSRGHLKVYSEPGHGTTIRLIFPAASDASVPATSTPVASNQTRQGDPETILLTEDDPDVLEVTQAFLEDIGYRVLTATNAEEALVIIESSVKLALLLTDFAMPGKMNGGQLARHAMRVRPKLKALICTGFADLSQLEKGEPIPMLHKPFTRSALIRAVATAIDGSHGVS